LSEQDRLLQLMGMRMPRWPDPVDPLELYGVVDYARVKQALREEVTSGDPNRRLPIGGAKSIAKILEAFPIPEGGSRDVEVEVPDGYTGMLITCRVSYAMGANGGARLVWLYSQDGVSFDDEDEAIAEGNFVDMGLAPGATRQRSVILAALPRFVRIRVRNTSTAANTPMTVDLWRTITR
jgi:hypothetical protein